MALPKPRRDYGLVVTGHKSRGERPHDPDATPEFVHSPGATRCRPCRHEAKIEGSPGPAASRLNIGTASSSSTLPASSASVWDESGPGTFASYPWLRMWASSVAMERQSPNKPQLDPIRDKLPSSSQ